MIPRKAMINCCSRNSYRETIELISYRIEKNPTSSYEERIYINMNISWKDSSSSLFTSSSCLYKINCEFTVGIELVNPMITYKNVEKPLYCPLKPGCRFCTDF